MTINATHTAWLCAAVVATVAAAIAFAPVRAAARDCARGEALFNEGVAAYGSGDTRRAARKLEQSLSECKTFASAYRLGQARQELNQLTAAADAFKIALWLVAGNDAKALALGRLAEIKRAQGDELAALTDIHRARFLHSRPPPPWMKELAMELDAATGERPLGVPEVTRSLSLPDQRLCIVDTLPGPSRGAYQPGKGHCAEATDNLYVSPPSLDNVRIHFRFDSTEVDVPSRANVRALAEALAHRQLAGKRFALIGHTDVRGERGYNQDLSERRARVVQAQILSLRPQLRGRLRSEGAGESRPLYFGYSESEHRFNRRLEVTVEG